MEMYNVHCTVLRVDTELQQEACKMYTNTEMFSYIVQKVHQGTVYFAMLYRRFGTAHLR